MAEMRGEAEAAADRLEAALERIAALAARPAPTLAGSAEPPASVPEIVDRLDALIAHLRQALDGPPA